MAEVFAPIPIIGTMHNLTFYSMEGRNFVRKKSSLTRRKVLYAAQFERTRHYAGLMAKASKIGSQVYKALPEYWRQFWMYQSFTGEALTLLKKGKKEQEIQVLLFERYVKEVAAKQPTEIPVKTTAKRAYRKLNTPYWKGKTAKSKRFHARKELTLHYASMLGRASKIASTLYRQLPFNKRQRRDYWHFVACAMQLLKQEWQEEEILEEFSGPSPSLSAPKELPHLKRPLGKLSYPEGWFYFVGPMYKVPRITSPDFADCTNERLQVAKKHKPASPNQRVLINIL
jgi:hypothetical protein